MGKHNIIRKKLQFRRWKWLSPNESNINIDVSNIMNPAFLLGIAFNIV